VEERAGREYEQGRELRRAEAEEKKRTDLAKERAAEELQAAKKAAEKALDIGTRNDLPQRCPICTLMPPCKHTEAADAAAGVDYLNDDERQAMATASSVPPEERKQEAVKHFKRGRALRSQWDDSGALFEFKVALLLDPTHKEAHCHRGAVLLASESAREAAAAFRAAIAVRYDYKEAHLYLGCALAELVEYEDALDEFSLVLKMDPDSGKAHYHLGRCLHTMHSGGEDGGKGLGSAIEHYKEALRINPAHNDAYFHMGRALEVYSGADTAIPPLREALRLSPDDGEFNFVLGQVLWAKGDIVAATELYKNAADLSNDEFEVQLVYGEALLAQSGGHGALCEEAVTQFKKALELNPSSALANFKCGISLKSLDRVQEAETYLEQAKSIDPSYTEGGGTSADHLAMSPRDRLVERAADGSTPRHDGTILEPRNAKKWGVAEVKLWLESTFAFGLDYTEHFTSIKVDGPTLLTVTEDELSGDLNVSVKMHRRRILDEISALKKSVDGNANGTTQCMFSSNGPGKLQLSNLGLSQDLIVYNYCAITKKWMEKNIKVKIAKNPFAKGAMRAAYYMEDLSVPAGTPHRYKVAKMYMKEESGTEGVMRRDVQIQEVARVYANAYNQNAPPKQVTFISAQYGTRQQHPRYIGIEMYLPGEYIKFNSNSDFAMRTCDANYHQTPQAFSHFTWEHSKRTEIVVDVQGVGEYYTDPQIHTVTGEGYGEGNLGKAGITAFFSKHKCNDVCRYLGLPNMGASAPLPFETKHSMMAGKLSEAMASALGDLEL